MKMLKLLTLTIAVTLCLSQDPGDYDYIACEDCKIPKDEFPKEGEMACYEVKKVMKMVQGKEWICEPPVECGFSDFLCVPQKEKCGWKHATIAIPACQLERKTNYNSISRIYDEDIQDTIYQIYSPRYHGYSEYKNNTYCAWNVANTGIVSLEIVDQKLQKPMNCSEKGCNCPDNVKISAETNEITLCGDKMPIPSGHLSSNGLHVTFCSDNKHTAKGVHLLARRLGESPKNPKREITIMQDQLKNNETYDNSSNELDHIACYYNYMMRVSQPDVPCPDDDTMKTMLLHHNRIMSLSSSNDGKCDGTPYPSSKMPMMNKLESCAVQYLYRTGDCEFAKMLESSFTGELGSIAHAFVDNDLKRPKWMHNGHKKCRRNEE